jgi:hypothetical protein
MLRRSQALHEFRSSIAIAETLMKKELHFSDPPIPRHLKEMQGLRGGATVLMVAAFENYLKEVIEERMDDLVHHRKFNPKKLPDELVFHNYNQMLIQSRDASSLGNLSFADKIAIFHQVAQGIINGIINSQFFSELAKSNPNSKKVRKLFKSLGIQDIFLIIKPQFDIRWGIATSNTFIPDTLDSILDRRHKVAHTAKVMNVSRLDLQDSARFLRILADLCDEELYRHIRSILR